MTISLLNRLIRQVAGRSAGLPADLLRDRSPLVVAQIFARLLPMALRGALVRPFLRRTAGLVLIGRGVRLHNPQYISLGRNFVAEDYCEIQGLAHEGLTFGDKVTIGSYAMIRPSGYYGREPGVGLRVGNFSNIGAYCYIGCSGGITIGDHVMMSPRVSLFAENHNVERADIPMSAQGVARAPIVIEDDCWIASHSVILAGVRVGRGAVVAAGSVVTKDVPPYTVVAGVPARVVRDRRGDGSSQAGGSPQAGG